MGRLEEIDPEIYNAICKEKKRETENIELIASENFTSDAVLEAQGSILTNKYAEGYPGARWYGGCEYVDIVEKLAIDRVRKLFNAEHVNVQPHSGSQANMAVYFAMLEPGDTVLAMDLACGGHLSHGHQQNFSGKIFKVIRYGVSKKDERIDYDDVLNLAKKYKPRIILAGACAYPRVIDFKRFREISDKVGAFLWVDMAHIAGLVAAGIHPSPVPYADFVTTTTHKTLRGPRAGVIMCRKEFAKKIDTQVFPGIQGGPLMHIIAAKAVAFKEALRPEFKDYQLQIVKNASCLSDELKKKNYRIVSGGTDIHLLLVDLTERNITGRDAALKLDKAKLTVNKNLIPFDPKPPSVTSGIRLGTPAVTTRGMKEPEMVKIVSLVDRCISGENEAVQEEIREEVKRFAERFPIYAW